MLDLDVESGLFETPLTKTSPATPRTSNLTRTPAKSESGSKSPLKNSRLSVDRSPGSPRSVNSKHNGAHRSPQNSTVSSIDHKKISTTTCKQFRSAKGSELQVELNSALEELKNAKELLAVVEKEKACVLKELKEAKRRADDADDKLVEAVGAKVAEECSEIERFRAVEIKQSSIDAAQQREDNWQKEMESLRNQCAADVSTLLSATQELEKAKSELAMIIEAKNAAKVHADEALSIAEFNVEKVAAFSEEVSRLKGLLDSKMQARDTETSERIKNLSSEIGALQSELVRAREAGKKLIEMQALIANLTHEVTDVKKAESDASNVADEWKKKAENLEIKFEETVTSERAASESLATSVKRLEECNASLKIAESEIFFLKGKAQSLDSEFARKKSGLDVSNSYLKSAKHEFIEMEKTAETLKFKLRLVEEEKMDAVDHGKQVASKLQSLIEEKDTLANELQTSGDEVEDVKRARDDLASAIHEISIESTESQERMLIKQAELADAKEKMKELKLHLKAREEEYEAMLLRANNEISHLKSIIEKSKRQAEELESEINREKVSFISSLTKLEDEAFAIKRKVDEVASKLKGAELEATTAKDEETQLWNWLNQAKLEAASANEAAEEARAESLQTKERLLDKENELQSIAQENDDLRIREEAAWRKINELSEQLEEVTAKKSHCNGELSNSGEDHDEESKTRKVPIVSNDDCELHDHTIQILHDKHHEQGEDETNYMLVNGSVNTQHKNLVPVKTGGKKWISGDVERQLSPGRDSEPENLDSEVNPTVENENLEQKNRMSSDSIYILEDVQNKEQHLHKKKNLLLHKFGKMLKRNN